MLLIVPCMRVCGVGQDIPPPTADASASVSAFNKASTKGWAFQLAAVVLFVVAVATNNTISKSRPDISLIDISSEALTWNNLSSFLHAVTIFAAKFIISKTQLTIIGADFILGLLFTIGLDLENDAIQGPYQKESRHARDEVLKAREDWINDQGVRADYPSCLDSLLGRMLEPRLPDSTASGEFHNPLNQSAATSSHHALHRSSGAIANDWEERFSTQHNRRYWVNRSTSETTWNQPRGSFAASNSISGARGGIAQRQQHDMGDKATTASAGPRLSSPGRSAGTRGPQHDGSYRHASSMRRAPGVGGSQQWVQRYSEKHGRPYWYHVETGERTWTDPSLGNASSKTRQSAIGVASTHSSSSIPVRQQQR